MKKAPENETKKERFKRLASLRTNEVLRRLKVLGNCANKQAYEYYEEDINKIFGEIDRKVKEIKSKFHFSKEKEFKL
jgi:uncharacterized FlaG/YvyC family protein